MNTDHIDTKWPCPACGTIENARAECKWCHGLGMVTPTMRVACLATLAKCPACEGCAICRGSHRVFCRVCPVPHVQTCPACQACGLCTGTQRVRDEVRVRWIEGNEPTPPAAA